MNENIKTYSVPCSRYIAAVFTNQKTAEQFQATFPELTIHPNRSLEKPKTGAIKKKNKIKTIKT